MNIAEIARPAVSALALAALAVSGTLFTRTEAAAPLPVYFAEPLGHVRLGPINVVGSPSYEAIVREVSAIAPELVRCAYATTRVTIYAHVRQRHVAQVTVFGDDAATTSCVEKIVAFMAIAVEEDVDLMIPVDLVK